ncbi:zinc-containing alcohol dehydrogenase, putative [Paecilomyces variotii No. 5]|uniref:Zinc-containing alcohol dehydrogenase, putative n=1 Tax=Byssochlamys spectabilis (strain No. 5 / NBRC 109023) TaxID=1356009 RepID=V5G5I7_BYSSN|nr:zinc-containing alcohol dehydrogenase, putative [Paecilomyces variotii No. 5]
MQAIRLHPAPPVSTPYSASNPAPSTALQLDHDVPIPVPSAPGELLIRVKATTVIRDMLNWPETYAHEYTILGNDVAGIVTEVSSASKFKPGDEVFGMTNTDRAATWAEYTIVKEDEIARKPATLTFTQAAALPLSAQTAYEALFEHARIPLPTVEEFLSQPATKRNHRTLITGAAGAVGVYLVQFAAAAGERVVAASSSNARNGEFLRGLGADEVVEYSMLDGSLGKFDVIIDVVGGEVLAKCWDYVTETGVLVSVDSASFDFVEEHERRGLWKAGVHALFFIVKGSPDALRYIAELAGVGAIRSFVADVYPLARAREAYDLANGRFFGRGKVILTV